LFLKRLDLSGFKSFADKTTLEFSPGLTAVVGPNGSGKSNVADAVRWVLGEQSARSLRGARMEDVIFAGSETRRGVNFCEVTLTLDNEDAHLPLSYSEVTVTRRLYRSGDSEYFINRQPCRLKDVHELFMDTGLGREAYSIIGQGRIEEMLSTRPEDRRGPFEDAAGIVKFKFRRREAERRLEETAANLTRVEDIVAELEREEGPLAVEAERAREYQAAEQALKEVELQLLMVDIEALALRQSQLLAERTEAEAAKATLVATLEEAEEAARKVFASVEERSARIESLQSVLADWSDQRQVALRQLAVLRERKAHTVAMMEERSRQHQEILSEIAEWTKNRSEIFERQGQLECDWQRYQNAVQELSKQAETTGREALEQEFAGLNRTFLALHQEVAAAKSEWQAAEASIEGSVERRRWVADQTVHMEEQLAQVVTKLEAVTKRQAVLTEEAERLQYVSQQLTEDYRLQTAEEQGISDMCRKAESQLSALSSRIEILKDLESGYDGYALGVKTVLQAAEAGRLRGVHGSVANLLVVQSSFEVAIETSLGAALQNLVVGSEADARAAIAYLKQRQSGRATFMPLDVIKPRRISAEEERTARSHPDCIGIAAELVVVDQAYESVLWHLLGNVLVADSLVAANRIAKAVRYRLRIVTREGDVVAPGGVMSGGSQGRRGPGLLGRSRERSELEERLLVERRNFEQGSASLKEIQRRVGETRRRSQEIADEQAANRTANHQLELELRELESQQTSVAHRIADLRAEMESFQMGNRAAHDRSEMAQQAMVRKEAEIVDVEARLAEIRVQLETADARVQERRAEMANARVELARLDQERAALEQRRAECDLRVKRLEDRLAELSREAERLELTAADLESEEASQAERLSRIEGETAGLDEAIQAVRMQRQEADADYKRAEERVSRLRLDVGMVDDRLHRAAVVAERGDGELRHALERLGEQYSMTYEWAKERVAVDTDVSLARQRAREWRSKLQSMGDVRLAALDEWTRLTERLTFLHAQRDDIQEAQAELQGVLNDLDSEMSARFQEAFERIRIEFQIAFRQLFQGGRADLSLTNPEDILSTGIEVHAEPPGKKLQSLNLLSGGERALTAMALLFAILRVRPVPFCVLDEVEAALDEANVGRFALQLQLFAASTQFIVITHRRGTMEAADVLYGVTMQQSGISSLVSVRLTDDRNMELA
jgi:chromosome segregation protein